LASLLSTLLFFAFTGNGFAKVWMAYGNIQPQVAGTFADRTDISARERGWYIHRRVLEHLLL
jgi:hypothetical protein